MTGISRKLRRALEEGPATVSELADDFDLPRRKVQVGMWILTSTGQAISKARVPNDRTRGARTLKLYELTRTGERLRKKDRTHEHSKAERR